MHASREAPARTPEPADFLRDYPHVAWLDYCRIAYFVTRHTATHNSRATDGPAAKKRRAKHRRQAQESLLALAEAQDGDSAAATTGICPPPPPLPATPPPRRALVM